MEKIIRIGGKDCRMKNSAALPRLYRSLLNREVFEDMGVITDVLAPKDEKEEKGKKIDLSTATSEELTALGYVEDLAFVMHKHGDPTQPNTVEAWLEQFDDPAAVFNVVFEILTLWNSGIVRTSDAQKKTGQSTEE